MYLGTQIAPRDDQNYRMWAQLGVNHLCADPPGTADDWTPEILQRHREHVESFGLTLDMVELPLTSHPLETQQSPHILLGKSLERHREMDSICRLIENLARAGIPAAKYNNLNIIGHSGTARLAGPQRLTPRSAREHPFLNIPSG